VWLQQKNEEMSRVSKVIRKSVGITSEDQALSLYNIRVVLSPLLLLIVDQLTDLR